MLSRLVRQSKCVKQYIFEGVTLLFGLDHLPLCHLLSSFLQPPPSSASDILLNGPFFKKLNSNVYFYFSYFSEKIWREDEQFCEYHFIVFNVIQELESFWCFLLHIYHSIVVDSCYGISFLWHASSNNLDDT